LQRLGVELESVVLIVEAEEAWVVSWSDVKRDALG